MFYANQLVTDTLLKFQTNINIDDKLFNAERWLTRIPKNRLKTESIQSANSNN